MRLRHRQLLLLTAAALTVALFVGVGAFALIRSAVRERFIERVSAETTLLATWVRDLREHQELHDFAQDSADRLRVRVTLIAEDGIVLADSATPVSRLPQLENHAGRPEVLAARALDRRARTETRRALVSARQFCSG